MSRYRRVGMKKRGHTPSKESPKPAQLLLKIVDACYNGCSLYFYTAYPARKKDIRALGMQPDYVFVRCHDPALYEAYSLLKPGDVVYAEIKHLLRADARRGKGTRLGARFLGRRSLESETEESGLDATSGN